MQAIYTMQRALIFADTDCLLKKRRWASALSENQMFELWNGARPGEEDSGRKTSYLRRAFRGEIRSCTSEMMKARLVAMVTVEWPQCHSCMLSCPLTPTPARWKLCSWFELQHPGIVQKLRPLSLTTSQVRLASQRECWVPPLSPKPKPQFVLVLLFLYILMSVRLCNYPHSDS